jgi:hypothetical protein
MEHRSKQQCCGTLLPQEELQMIGKITIAAALLIGTAAIAQQNQNNPTAPSNPAAPHTAIQNLAECWDGAANRVRNPRTVGVNAGANPSAPQNQQSPGNVSPTNNRPAGMKNC